MDKKNFKQQLKKEYQGKVVTKKSDEEYNIEMDIVDYFSAEDFLESQNFKKKKNKDYKKFKKNKEEE